MDAFGLRSTTARCRGPSVARRSSASAEIAPQHNLRRTVWHTESTVASSDAATATGAAWARRSPLVRGTWGNVRPKRHIACNKTRAHNGRIKLALLLRGHKPHIDLATPVGCHLRVPRAALVVGASHLQTGAAV